MRYFQLKEKKDIIFTDKYNRNVKYNTSYKEGADYKLSEYQKNKVTYFYNPTNFYEKRGQEIYHINLTGVKYSSGQEIESTENIIKIYTIEDFTEIIEEEAIKILKENELSFSELFDKNLLGNDI